MVAAERIERSGRATRASNPLLADLVDLMDLGPASPEAPNGATAHEKPSEAADRSSATKAPEGSRAPAHGPICTVGICPICTLVTAFGDVRPELTEHLLLAGREVLLALKVLIDSRLQADEPDDGAPNGLERIKID